MTQPRLDWNLSNYKAEAFVHESWRNSRLVAESRVHESTSRSSTTCIPDFDGVRPVALANIRDRRRIFDNTRGKGERVL